LTRFIGALRVFPGAIVFAARDEGLAGAMNRAMNVEQPPVKVVNTDQEVAVIQGRLAAPWLNTGLVLVDSETLHGGTAIVQFAGWERRPLLDALRSAGFSLDVHESEFSIGSDIGSTVELARMRRGTGRAN
jgi:hypothetical protein